MTLYVIGNGFDLHHGLDTWYSTFGRFLRDNYPEQYENLIKYYSLPEFDDDEPDEDIKNAIDNEWSTFEDQLALVDSEEILDEHVNYLADVSSDDYNTDVHSFGQEIAGKVTDLTDKLFSAFREFIIQVAFPGHINDKRLVLDADSIFLSFNYTDTLQRYYGIPVQRIKYIHGNANVPDQVLVLGHGRTDTPANEPPPQMPEGLSEEAEEYWRDQQSNNYDYSYESGKDEMNNYFNITFKNAPAIINDNEEFFNALANFDKVVILGHSLAGVDSPYFLKLVQVINNPAVQWSASCRKDQEIEEKKQKLIAFGLNEQQVSIFNMNTLLEVNQ